MAIASATSTRRWLLDASGEFVFIADPVRYWQAWLAPFLGATIFETVRSYAYEYSPNTWQMRARHHDAARHPVPSRRPVVGVHPLAQGAPDMNAILEARSVNKSFGAVTAAADINVAIQRDSVVGLIGSNGAGKTTFINMVTGYLYPPLAAFTTKGARLPAWRRARSRGWVFAARSRFPSCSTTLTVRENLQVGVGIAARSTRAAGTENAVGAQAEAGEIEELIERFNLSGYRGQLAGLLPEGVRKLLDIGMAVAGRPSLLLLDEPTSGVSADEKFRLMDMVMSALKAQAITVSSSNTTWRSSGAMPRA